MYGEPPPCLTPGGSIGRLADADISPAVMGRDALTEASLVGAFESGSCDHKKTG